MLLCSRPPLDINLENEEEVLNLPLEDRHEQRPPYADMQGPPRRSRSGVVGQFVMPHVKE